MATYKNGSSGTEVKKLQQSLIDAGYNVGSSGADGIYGSNTAAAVKQYQQDNGLTVDGVAGEQTLGKLYGTTSPAGTTSQTNVPQQNKTQQKPSQQTQAAAPKYPTNTYDPVSDAAYQQALSALQNAQKQMPTYAGTYDQQLQDVYNQIVGRDKFSYDMNADALYQQYADQYRLGGELASMDVMGQAAALTGGYGNSYAQMVGQQTYQGYLQKLNEVMPELYGMALDQYNAEGDRLYDQYAMLGDLANDEYGKYQDALDGYWQNISYLKGEADDAYNRGMAENEMAYDRQQDAYANLVSLMTATGYTPTEEDLLEAGMSQGEADAYLRLYAQENAPSGGGGGSYYYGGGGDDDDLVGDDVVGGGEEKFDNRTAAQIESLVNQMIEKYGNEAAVRQEISKYFTAKQRPVATAILNAYISGGEFR